jgi:hypothetical protein
MTRAEARTVAMPWPLRVVLAPLHAVERSRGRRRVLILLAYSLLLSVLALLGWRAMSLRGLPDVGDPFDPEEFEARLLPEDENAFTLYRQASRAFKAEDRPEYRTGGKEIWSVDSWAEADPLIHRWVEDNTEALALWMRGSEQEAAMFIDPRTMRFSTLLKEVQDLRSFARLGRLEAFRRMEAGDVAGAWPYYRGVLRASRHVGMGSSAIGRLIGMAMASYMAPEIERWAADPRLDAEDLRRALDDVRAVRAMNPPYSETAKVEYLLIRNELTGPGSRETALSEYRSGSAETLAYLPGALETLWWLKREPERSLRVARLAFAGWIAHADEPASKRPAPRPTPHGFEWYPLPDEAPASARSLSPTEFDDWMQSSLIARIYLPAIGPLQSAFERDRRTLAAIEIALASQLYEREHGEAPKTLGVLVGPYLDRVPEGYEGLDDPAMAGEKAKAR